MDQAYQARNFNEIQSTKGFASRSASENLEDFCHYFTSSDESFNSNSSSNSDESFEKKNDVLKTCDLLLNDEDRKSNCVNYNDVDINENNTLKTHHKSFRSIIKYVKKMSAKSEKSNDNQQPSRSILRRPTEYTFVKGISGVPIRVAKVSPSTSNHRYISKD